MFHQVLFHSLYPNYTVPNCDGILVFILVNAILNINFSMSEFTTRTFIQDSGEMFIKLFKEYYSDIFLEEHNKQSPVIFMILDVVYAAHHP